MACDAARGVGLGAARLASQAAAQAAPGQAPPVAEQVATPPLGQAAVAAPGAPETAAAVQSSTQLQEVVVTAQRRAEKL